MSAPTEWESHKPEIIELYRDPKNTIDDIVRIMKGNGFSASKSGYERRLKDWGVRKNRDRKSLALLRIKHEQRQRQHKATDVYVNNGGKLLKLDIAQATARCFVPTHAKYADCETPPWSIVITPTSDGYMASVRTEDLPYVHFLRVLAPIKNLHMSIDMPPEAFRRLLPIICPKAVPENLTIENIFLHLTAVLPPNPDLEVIDILRKVVGVYDYAKATIELLKLMVFLLSNHLFGDEDDESLVCDELLHWFQMGSNYQLLEAIISSKMPTIEAFAEGIFTSAVFAEDMKMTRVFLNSGIDPNIALPDRSDRSLLLGKSTALQIASKASNINLIKLILDYGADVDLIPEGGDGEAGCLTPLQHAARSGYMEIAQLLIDRGAVVDKLGNEGRSALHHASSEGHLDLVKLLLDRGADINIESDLYGSPLECAAQNNHLAMVDLLLGRGPNVKGTNHLVNTPLQSVCKLDNVGMVQRLLDAGADANAPARQSVGYLYRDARTALEWAAYNGNTEICRMLIAAGAEDNGAFEIMLAKAIKSSDARVVEYLLSCGADIYYKRRSTTALEAAFNAAKDLSDDSDATTIVRMIVSAYQKQGDWLVCAQFYLLHAVKTRDFDLITSSIASGADVDDDDNRNGKSALGIAVELEDLDLVQHLLDSIPYSGAVQRRSAIAPLLRAVKLGNYELVRILVKSQAHCDEYGSMEGGQTWDALQLAARTGNLLIVQCLLEAGAAINAPAGYLDTALQAAVESGSFELVKYLIGRGADLNSPATEVYGRTTLQAAVAREDEWLVRELLSLGAIANDLPSKIGGRTSLQKAAELGNNDLVCILLGHGADVNWPAGEEWGLTALQAAALGGHYETVALLLDKGADVNGPACRIGCGYTALQAAAEGGYLHIADVLLKKGANVNAPGSESEEYRDTALVRAAESGRLDMLKSLLNNGADIRSDFGRAQLEKAMARARNYGHDAAAKYLKYHQLC